MFGWLDNIEFVGTGPVSSRTGSNPSLLFSFYLVLYEFAMLLYHSVYSQKLSLKMPKRK